MVNKLKTLEEMKTIVNKLKRKGKRIVLANGCFDLLHVGHIRYLEGAKRLGDVLIVGLNSDESTKAIKGGGRPIVPQGDRAEVLSALACVDYIVIFSETTADKLLLELRPHLQAKGTDYSLENVPELETVRSYGGEVAITGDLKSHSTKDLIERILTIFEEGVSERETKQKGREVGKGVTGWSN